MANGFYLTLLMGPLIPVPALKPVIEALKDVQITTNAGQRSGFQISFTLSKESMLNSTLLPAGYFDPGIRVIIIVTFGGMPNVLMDGVITRQDVAPSSEPGGSTLSVTGEDISLLMDLNDQGSTPFPAMPAEARIALIIAKYALYGIIPLIIPSLFPDVPIPVKEIPFEKGTDLSYIQLLAEENGYVFYIDPGPAPGMNLAYWGPEIRIGIPQSALNINMDANTNVESLSFGYDGLARKQLAIVIQEPITKIGIPIPLPDITLLRPPLALKQAPSMRVVPLRDVTKFNPIRAATLGLSKAAASSDAISGSGTLDVLRYGHILMPRKLVGVRGAGMAYDGLYYVKSVTHNIKRGEYKQNFSLTRNGLISLTPKVIP